MHFRQVPPSAAWWHHQARCGFEVTYFHHDRDGLRVTGCTTAVEDGQTWIVDYEIHLDTRWRTRWARVRSRSATGIHAIELETDRQGRWRLDGRPAPHLEGCSDIDLESSAMTNAVPVHRLALNPGQRAPASAAYVRAPDLAVERLEQEYARIDDDHPRQRYTYTAPAFGLTGELVYDETGLVLRYPGLASRAECDHP